MSDRRAAVKTWLTVVQDEKERVISIGRKLLQIHQVEISPVQ